MSTAGALEQPAAARRTRIFTPARIIALVLSAVLVSGLIFRRKPDSSPQRGLRRTAQPLETNVLELLKAAQAELIER
jgi:hypothetical protein